MNTSRIVLVEMNKDDGLPDVRAVTQPHFLRLAVAAAYQAGKPIPLDLSQATITMRELASPVFAFPTIEEADRWAGDYAGEAADRVRFVVTDFLLTHCPAAANQKASA